MRFCIPGLHDPASGCGLIPLDVSPDGLFTAGKDGTGGIYTTADRKITLVVRGGKTLACAASSTGFPAYYPLPEDPEPLPFEAVMLDLDGTTVKSEAFWISVIEMTAATLRGDPRFAFTAEDIPYVSGHSVSEHLNYCIEKYAPGHDLTGARSVYFEHTRREMDAILKNGRTGAFTLAPGAGDFLKELKSRGLKTGLVTSGLYEKAMPEIISAFRAAGMGDPCEFFDSIITAGTAPGRGVPGTLGELEPKPHPWLYAECFTVGMGIPFARRGAVMGIEDSGAGVCSVRLAGAHTVGMAGGNIDAAGCGCFCHDRCENFEEVLKIIDSRR